LIISKNQANITINFNWNYFQSFLRKKCLHCIFHTTTILKQYYLIEGLLLLKNAQVFQKRTDKSRGSIELKLRNEQSFPRKSGFSIRFEVSSRSVRISSENRNDEGLDRRDAQRPKNSCLVSFNGDTCNFDLILRKFVFLFIQSSSRCKLCSVNLWLHLRIENTLNFLIVKCTNLSKFTFIKITE
jgi:hypothetical protein